MPPSWATLLSMRWALASPQLRVLLTAAQVAISLASILTRQVACPSLTYPILSTPLTSSGQRARISCRCENAHLSTSACRPTLACLLFCLLACSRRIGFFLTPGSAWAVLGELRTPVKLSYYEPKASMPLTSVVTVKLQYKATSVKVAELAGTDAAFVHVSL